MSKREPMAVVVRRWQHAYELAFSAQAPPAPSAAAIVAFHEIAAEEYAGLVAKERFRKRRAGPTTGGGA